MNIRALNVLLLVCLAGLGIANRSVQWNVATPNYEFLPDMAHSVRYNSFASNSNFADRKTLQAPVPGTIPRGSRPLHYQATPESAVQAGEELRNPYAASDQAPAQRGAAVYGSFCQVCHGAGGRGDGPVVLRGFPAPPSLLAEHSVTLKDGQIFHILTFGQKNMPSYAAQIAEEDRWKVILYLRYLQAPSQGTPGPATKSAN
jgi:mono/diheme cytochrome c family protein